MLTLKQIIMGGGADKGEPSAPLTHNGSSRPVTEAMRSQHALLICRDASSRKWGPRWLEQSGFQTTVLQSSSHALARISEELPAVIVLESTLRDANGSPLFETISKLLPSRNIPMLVLCSGRQDVQRALDAGVTDVIRRPVDWQLVGHRASQAVKASLAQSELVSASLALSDAMTLANETRRDLRRIDTIDPTTQLPNRKNFRGVIDRVLSRRGGNRFAVIVVGLDRFDLVNEVVGHDQGNQVLQEVGVRLRDALEGRDLLPSDATGLVTAAVAALGGAKFGLLITNAEQLSMSRLQEGILEMLAKPFEVERRCVYLSASIGASIYPQDANNADHLLLRAETAMLEARRRGGGLRVYQEVIDCTSARKLALDTMLRSALQDDEFHIEYQPLLDVKSERVVGAEALLRWTQPEEGPVSPGEFIPIAEQNGLMVPIGRYVLEKACQQLRAWADAGRAPIRMAVNVSICQLLQGDFASIVAQAIKEHRLDPSLLELELSERGVAGRDGEILSQLQQLKEIGVRLAVDDFGTGDSSISYLKELPIDVLKIDRSYISGALTDLKNKAIASGIVALAERLELTVVAEGVESKAQLDMLREWGCHQWQGFYFSPAVPAREFVTLLADAPQVVPFNGAIM